MRSIQPMWWDVVVIMGRQNEKAEADMIIHNPLRIFLLVGACLLGLGLVSPLFKPSLQPVNPPTPTYVPDLLSRSLLEEDFTTCVEKRPVFLSYPAKCFTNGKLITRPGMAEVSPEQLIPIQELEESLGKNITIVP